MESWGKDAEARAPPTPGLGLPNTRDGFPERAIPEAVPPHPSSPC